MDVMTDGTIPMNRVATRQNLGSLRGSERATQGRRWAGCCRYRGMSCGSVASTKRGLRSRKGGIAP